MFERAKDMNKYHAKKQEYKGRVYDSQLEANYAWELDQRKKKGEIVSWKAQYKLPIVINNIKICTYIADFFVTFMDDIFEIHEVKGYETATFKLKWKLVQALYPDYTFVLIK